MQKTRARPQRFYKYATADTATAILRNRTLRWSSPILFNDPFDVPRELSFGIDPAQIANAVAKRIRQLIKKPPQDTSEFAPKLRMLLEYVKSGKTETRREIAQKAVRWITATRRPSDVEMNALRGYWRQLLVEFRILCLTESPDHVAMWYHYADQYQGVVLEMQSNDESDSPWLMARPVRYSKRKPIVYTAGGWAKLLTMTPEHATRTLFDVAAFTKAKDWSYESEWRITTFRRSGDEGNYSDWRFHTRDLTGVYLGPLIAEQRRTEIVGLSEAYPNATIWQTTIGMSRQFHHTKLKGPSP